jgi:hypothetical protein
MLALGKLILMAYSIFFAISKVTSLALFRSSKDSLFNTFIISCERVPLIDASRLPFLPFPDFTVTKVYISPCDNTTSSMLIKRSIFWG